MDRTCLHVVTAEGDDDNRNRLVGMKAREKLPPAIHPRSILPAEERVFVRVVEHGGATIQPLGHNQHSVAEVCLEDRRPPVCWWWWMCRMV